jgi:hypothetical protein
MKIKTIIEGDWYDPKRYLESLPSVIVAELMDTTSSAGDWSGMLVRKSGKKYQVYLFSQENRWPNGGFNLSISRMIYSQDTMPSDEVLADDYQSLCY